MMKILTSEELLQQQLSEISEQQASKTKPIEIPKSIGISYNAELQRMVNLIRVDIEESLTPQIKNLAPEYTADSWVDVITSSLKSLRERWSNDRFNRWAEGVAQSFIQAINLQNQKQFANQFKSFGIDIFSSNKTVNDYLQASVENNVSLIKSIPDQYLSQVESIVLSNMRSGLRPSAIEKQLTDQFGVTKRRARVIARDQSSKASNGLAKKRMESSGIVYFQWIDSSDNRVRSRHKAIANKLTAYGKGVYRLDTLPLNDTGVPIACGDDYQCRCVARPVLKSEVLRNQKSGNVAKGVKR